MNSGIVFEVGYLSIEARTYSAERVGGMRHHETIFVRALTLEGALTAVKQWYDASHSHDYDFGGVWSVKRHSTGEMIDLTS